MKMCLFLLCSALVFGQAFAESATITVSRDGRVERARRPLADGSLVVASPSVGAADWVEVVPDFATARVGEPGFFVLPNGFYGEFTCPTNGECALGAAMMPMFGMKTPRKTFVAFVDGLPWSYKTVVRVKDGTYSVALRFMLGNRVNVVESTSAGRLFDGVSAILGCKERNSFEGEMSMQLQFAAEQAEAPEIYDGPLIAKKEDFFYLETGSLVREIARGRLSGKDAGALARMFHEVLSQMVLEGCRHIRREDDISTAALTGGVFQNTLLLELCRDKLEHDGFRVLTHSLVPPNDGGIALGQAVYGARKLEKEDSRCV